jgi:hypothetical protein
MKPGRIVPKRVLEEFVNEGFKNLSGSGFWEVYGRTFTQPLIIDRQCDALTEWFFTFVIQPGKCFLLRSISLSGLASDMLNGRIRIKNLATGQDWYETELLRHAIRNRRALSIPIMFAENTIMEASILFRDPVSPGLDLLGRPRKSRRVTLCLDGDIGHRIQ